MFFCGVGRVAGEQIFFTRIPAPSRPTPRYTITLKKNSSLFHFLTKTLASPLSSPSTDPLASHSLSGSLLFFTSPAPLLLIFSSCASHSTGLSSHSRSHCCFHRLSRQQGIAKIRVDPGAAVYGVSLSLSRLSPLTVGVSLSSHSLSVSLSLSISRSVSPSLSISRSVSRSLDLSLSISQSLTLDLSISLSISLCHCRLSPFTVVARLSPSPTHSPLSKKTRPAPQTRAYLTRTAVPEPARILVIGLGWRVENSKTRQVRGGWEKP
jgi:hypothetical protein